jgi:hypothetical protein
MKKNHPVITKRAGDSCDAIGHCDIPAFKMGIEESFESYNIGLRLRGQLDENSGWQSGIKSKSLRLCLLPITTPSNCIPIYSLPNTNGITIPDEGIA